MVKFEPVSKEDIKNLISVRTYVQGFLAIFANNFMNISFENISGIAKFEGGITVNNCEIVIYRDSVRDDFKEYGSEATPEELATVKAIQKFQNEIDFTNENTIEQSMIDMYGKLNEKEQDMFQAFGQNPFRGDYLRNYLNIPFNEII